MIKTNKNITHKNNNTKSTKFNIKSHKNRIKNWTAYNKSLVNRGDFYVAIEDALLAPAERTGKPGRPKLYSDLLIKVILEIREFIGGPFRQTAGFIGFIVRLAGLSVKVPDYTTINKRMSGIDFNLNLEPKRITGPIYLLIDSTGLKICGEGEWKDHKHGRDKRRGWTKLHVGYDYDSEQIVAFEVTNESVADEKELPAILAQTKNNGIPIKQIIGDGAYDSNELYEIVESNYVDDKKPELGKISLLAPPPTNAVWHGKLKGNQLVGEPGWETRNGYVGRCMVYGREKWKEMSGYHKRSLAETAMYRLKKAFTGELKSKKDENREKEIAIRIGLLNRWTNQGMPAYT